MAPLLSILADQHMTKEGLVWTANQLTVGWILQIGLVLKILRSVTISLVSHELP